MRIAVALLLLVACKSEIKTQPIDVLEFPSFTIKAPFGYHEVVDRRALATALPNSHTIKPLVQPPGFASSIYVQELTMSPADHAQLAAVTDDTCRTTFLEPMSASAKATPVSARAITAGAFKGCDGTMATPPQAARNISITNGTVGVSITCNRDAGNPAASDATCLALANAITLRK